VGNRQQLVKKLSTFIKIRLIDKLPSEAYTTCMKLTAAKSIKVGQVLHLGNIAAEIFKKTKNAQGQIELHIHAPDHVWFTYHKDEPAFVS